MGTRPLRSIAVVFALTLVVCHQASAQGAIGGSLFGSVTDMTGAALSGVNVTCRSPAQMGVQTAVTSDRGTYRFPLLVPGVYSLSFDRPGFSRLIREGIVVGVDFSGEINAELTVETVRDVLVVRGDSPVIDSRNTTIQTTFTSETLKDIPGGRDLMSLIGLLPATIMSVHDVGGSTTGTQPIYLTYGQFSFQQFQSRVQLDGINTTDAGMGGLYFDYGAFEEVRLGASSNDASMPNPGLQVNAVLKTGGNEFRGEAHVDYGDDAFQSDNVDESLRRQGVGRGSGIQRYNDLDANFGGPVKRDTLWFFTAVRNQHLSTLVTGFPVGAPGEGPDALIQLQNLTYKLTYQPRPRSTLSHSVQLGHRYEPYRGASAATYRDAVAEHDTLASAGNLEWRETVSPSFFMITRASAFGSDVRADAYGPDGQVGVNIAHRRFDFQSRNSAGGAETLDGGRRRRQLEWTGTLYGNDWRGVNHDISMGALTEWETTDTERTGYEDSVRLLFGGSPDFTVPSQVELYNYPVASSDRLWHNGAYLQDQIALSPRWTLNIGTRWDWYSAYYPEQSIREGLFTDAFYRRQPLPNDYCICTPPFGDTVPAGKGIVEYKAAFGPRIGLAWKVQESGNAVVKGSWGRYYHDPGTSISRGVNPLQTTSYTFTWADPNGDREFQPTELGSFVNSSGGVQNGIDPHIRHPYTDNVDVWVDRRIRADFSARLGFVYKKSNDNWELTEQARVAALFTERREFQDDGPDGLRGTGDDRTYAAFDIPEGIVVPPSRKVWQTPADSDETFKSIEVAVNKRWSNRWAFSSSFLNTWVHRLENGHPDNPNEAINNDARFMGWAFKAFGTYQAPRGIRISPVVRHQAGRPSGRFVTPALRAGVFVIQVEPAGTYREDDRTIFDTRVEKQLRLGKVRTLSLFVDAFNIFNSNAAQAQDVFTGRLPTMVAGQPVDYQRFLRPLTILPPRIFHVGFRLSF